jgi:hypothetical protein
MRNATVIYPKPIHPELRSFREVGTEVREKLPIQ